MKRLSLLLLMALLSGGLSSLYPCDVHMETSPAAGSKNRIQVKLFVECIHRNCPLGIEKTKLETKDMVIEKQGQWKMVEAGVYQLDLIVSLNGRKKGELLVLRDCPKRGRQDDTLTVAPL